MMLLSPLLLFIFFTGTAFAKSDLDARMAQYKLLQSRVEKECLKNPKSNDYKITVDGKQISCKELIFITNQFRISIDKEVAELKACEENAKAPHNDLAASAGNILKNTPSCTPSPDSKQCLAKFGCSMLAATAPIKLLMKASANVLNSPVMKSCAGQTNDCLVNVLRGVFDSIWSSLSLIWDIGKLAVTKTGELFGFVKKSEAATSDKAMAAQQAGPGFLKKLASDPIGTVQTLAKNLYDSLEQSAINHYGCEKWAGIPFTSKCLAPMSTWQCGSCAQKAQVYCGIAGYAVGEIGTALLTGGLVAGGKTVILGSVKLASGPAKNVAMFMGKTFPKASTKVAKAADSIGTLAKTALSAAEVKSIAVWNSIANSSTSKLLANSASKISSSAVGKVIGTGLKPIGWYLKAMDDAFRLGFNSVDNLASGATKTAVVTDDVLKASNLADEAMGVSKPNLVPVKDQSKVAPGSILVESKGVEPVTKITPPSVVVEPKVIATPPASAKVSAVSESNAGVSSKVQASGILDESIDFSREISKFKNDQEYFKLFAQPKLYDDYHNDLAAVILTLERTQPNLTRIEIRKSIEKMMNSCDL